LGCHSEERLQSRDVGIKYCQKWLFIPSEVERSAGIDCFFSRPQARTLHYEKRHCRRLRLFAVLALTVLSGQAESTKKKAVSDR